MRVMVSQSNKFDLLYSVLCGNKSYKNCYIDVLWKMMTSDKSWW